MKKAKDDWIQDQCASINKDMNNNRSNKKAYNTLKLLTKRNQKKTMIILDKDDKPIAEHEAVMKRWTEYCNELYNYPIKTNVKLNHNEANKAEADTSLPILESEVEHAIKSLKDGKTPGPDNIPSELIKHGGENIQKLSTSLCQMIWNTKEWPIQWTCSLVIPIPKKGDSRKCSNFRIISLINHASKILLKILLNRLNPQAEKNNI